LTCEHSRRGGEGHFSFMADAARLKPRPIKARIGLRAFFRGLKPPFFFCCRCGAAEAAPFQGTRVRVEGGRVGGKDSSNVSKNMHLGELSWVR